MQALGAFHAQGNGLRELRVTWPARPVVTLGVVMTVEVKTQNKPVYSMISQIVERSLYSQLHMVADSMSAKIADSAAISAENLKTITEEALKEASGVFGDNSEVGKLLNLEYLSSLDKKDRCGLANLFGLVRTACIDKKIQGARMLQLNAAIKEFVGEFTQDSVSESTLVAESAKLICSFQNKLAKSWASRCALQWDESVETLSIEFMKQHETAFHDELSEIVNKFVHKFWVQFSDEDGSGTQ